MNAVRHGLLAEHLVLTTETEPGFLQLQQSYVEEWSPKSVTESDLVSQMVSAMWRLQRIWAMETAAIDTQMDRMEKKISQEFTRIDEASRTSLAYQELANTGNTLALYSRYEATFHRNYHRALKALRELHAARQTLQPDAPQELPNEPKQPAAPIEEFPNEPKPETAKEKLPNEPNPPSGLLPASCFVLPAPNEPSRPRMIAISEDQLLKLGLRLVPNDPGKEAA